MSLTTRQFERIRQPGSERTYVLTERKINGHCGLNALWFSGQIVPRAVVIKTRDDVRGYHCDGTRLSGAELEEVLADLDLCFDNDAQA